jgi:hypothetical protein
MSHADRIHDQRHRRAADRARRYRQRQVSDRAIVPVEIDQSVTAYLVDVDQLRADQVENRLAIGNAIKNLIDLLIAARHLRRHA